MAARSEIWLKNALGLRVDLIDEFASLSYEHALNEVTELRLLFDARGVDTALLVEGVPIEVWRTIEGGDAAIGGRGPYLEWEGLVTDRLDTLLGPEQSFELTALGYLDLIDRRIIGYPHDHARTIKDQVPAETIIKEFADHNAGPNATTGGGRLADGVTAGLTIAADGATGPDLSGQGTLTPLLPILQRVAAASSSQPVPVTMDFDVIGTGPLAGIQTFAFQTFSGGRGDDRSGPPAADSHLNAAGFRPLIFNPELGNLANPIFRTSPGHSKNRVFALGRGVFGNQIIRIADNATGQAFNLALREMVANAEEAQDNDATDALGEAELAAAKGAASLDGDIVQAGEWLYGRDYVLGDTVTLRFRDFESDRRVAAVRVQVADGEEVVEIELSEPPTDAPS